MGEEYTALAYETSKKRITLAGYRLANIVIDIYRSALKEDDGLMNIWRDKYNIKKPINLTVEQ